MTSLLTYIFLLGLSSIAFSQNDTLSASFENTYKKTCPNLHYVYDKEKQTHNYSGNWDMDQDGKADEVYFIGTGGAHLYYFLRVILSSDNKTRDFPFLESDFPMLVADSALKNTDYSPKSSLLLFAIYDFDNDKIPDILIRIDNSTRSANTRILKKNKLKTNNILLSFKNSKSTLKDLPK